jgi:hypothetical protein
MGTSYLLPAEGRQMATETIQPDPEVVAWMRDYRQRNPQHQVASAAVAEYLAHLAERDPVAALRWRRHLTPLVSAWVAAKPATTVTDIPAGQGAASLFIAPDSSGWSAAWYKDADDQRTLVMYDPAIVATIPSHVALWEHLAATLPAVEDAVSGTGESPGT